MVRIHLPPAASPLRTDFFRVRVGRVSRGTTKEPRGASFLPPPAAPVANPTAFLADEFRQVAAHPL
jgi:hypothetical protein